MATIGVLYSCEGCGAKDVRADVRERAPGEPLLEWMRALQLALTRAHRERSPGCAATAMQEVKIPMLGRTHVGGPVEN